MNLAEVSKHGCNALFAGRLIVVYDEYEACITSKGKTLERLNIKEIRKFAEKLNMAMDEMLENYKTMSLDEKMEFCNRNEITYKEMQELTTREEIGGHHDTANNR